MSSVVNSNVPSMFAQAALETNSRNLERASNQLSTGKRTYSAAVDAAGLAISEKLTAQIRGSLMAARNVSDGISFMQTAEGALNEIANMAQRMRELAVEKANTTTLNSTQLGNISTEMTTLASAISDIVSNTLFNDQTVIGASFVVTNSQSGGTATLSLTALGTAVSAGSAASAIDTYIASVATQRADAGAYINRMSYMVDNFNNAAANLTASRSRIQDTNYAQASADLAKAQIINQAATAMLAQANQMPQVVLSLLK